MLRADHGDATSDMTAFTRGSGTYALQGDGHANLYQLFLERSLSVVQRGGRLGLVLPSGFATDHGCAALRTRVLGCTGVDTFVSVENRDGLFPIHRGLKFLLVCATAGQRTATLPVRSGVRSPEVLDQLPDIGADGAAVPLGRTLLDCLSGSQLAIPEIRTAQDLEIVSRIACSVPALGDPDGWHVGFGRELNASDDRRHFVTRPSGGRHYPVLEGKQLGPFTVDIGASRFHLAARLAPSLLDPVRTYKRPRLAYRDVASATNRLTLIAAVIPAGVVTTHTLFCLRQTVEDDVQQFLCGVFNSYVANYLVRLRVGTHVTVAIIDRLPVPRPARDSALFLEIAGLAATLGRDPSDLIARSRLQASVARVYGFTRDEFAHCLTTFPLIDEAERRSALDVFEQSI
jgi:hypothetical protein